MTRYLKSILLGAGFSIWAASALGSMEVDGVLGLYPVGESSCIAVEIQAGGQALSSVRWFHNDESQAFPELRLMEGAPGVPPDLSDTALLLAQITGESLAWGQVDLESPVTSTTGTIYAVFVFPAFQERVGEGLYGGPGIGYRATPGSRSTYLSHDGVAWIALHKGFDMAVDPVFAAGKRASVSLAALKAARDPDDEESGKETEIPKRTALFSPFPNPFNPRVEIPFDLAASGRLELSIYDVRGRQVRTLLRETRPPGHYSIPWLGLDGRGQTVASGVYYVRMRFEGATHTKPLTLLR